MRQSRREVLAGAVVVAGLLAVATGGATVRAALPDNEAVTEGSLEKEAKEFGGYEAGKQTLAGALQNLVGSRVVIDEAAFKRVGVSDVGAIRLGAIPGREAKIREVLEEVLEDASTKAGRRLVWVTDQGKLYVTPLERLPKPVKARIQGIPGPNPWVYVHELGPTFFGYKRDNVRNSLARRPAREFPEIILRGLDILVVNPTTGCYQSDLKWYQLDPQTHQLVPRNGPPAVPGYREARAVLQNGAPIYCGLSNAVKDELWIAVRASQVKVGNGQLRLQVAYVDEGLFVPSDRNPGFEFRTFQQESQRIAAESDKIRRQQEELLFQRRMAEWTMFLNALEKQERIALLQGLPARARR